jgi:hypothetical protein
MKAQADVNGQVIEIDTEGMEKRITENISASMTKQMEQLKLPVKDSGKGIVEAFSSDKKAVILEELRKGGNADIVKLKEQWTICVPNFATKELAGHLRDYVFVTDAVKGKAGEVVNIPYVRDIAFDHLTVKSSTIPQRSGLISVLTTTLHESGAYYDAYYGDIEKIDSNMLDELNRVFAHAAIRSEDEDLIHIMDDVTTADMVSVSGESRTLFGESTTGFVSQEGVILGNSGSAFKAQWVARGLSKFAIRGKEARPGEVILILGPKHYRDLLVELSTSQPLSFAKGGQSAISTGMLEDYLGVKIVVVGHPGKMNTPTGSTNSFEVAYMIRPKRTLALAPKRDILIETDKIIDARQLRITGSHTYGVVVLDPTEIVRILTKYET